MNKSKNHERSATLSLVTAMLIWGTLGLFVRYIPLPSSMIALSRGVIGTLFILLFLGIKGLPISWTAIRQNGNPLFACGFFLGFNWIFLFEAYHYTSVAIATLCYYMAPIFVIVTSPFIFKERLTPFRLGCVAAALVGMVLISGIGTDTDTSGLTGILFGLSAAVLYASIVIINKKMPPMPAYDRTFVQLGVAAITLCPYILCTEDVTAISLSPMALGLLLFLGIVHTGFAYVLYFGSIEHLRAQTLALFSYLDPIFAIIVSALILGEPLTITTIIGAILVLGSTCLCELKHE